MFPLISNVLSEAELCGNTPDGWLWQKWLHTDSARSLSLHVQLADSRSHQLRYLFFADAAAEPPPSAPLYQWLCDQLVIVIFFLLLHVSQEEYWSLNGASVLCAAIPGPQSTSTWEIMFCWLCSSLVQAVFLPSLVRSGTKLNVKNKVVWSILDFFKQQSSLQIHFLTCSVVDVQTVQLSAKSDIFLWLKM